MVEPTLVVLAAGMGSRYGGVKQIDAVGIHDEILTDYAVYDAMQAGFGKVVFVIRKDIEEDFKERFFNRIARNFNAEYVFQSIEDFLSPEELGRLGERKKPWGTTHALLCAKKAIEGPFAVINADDYYGRLAYKSVATHLLTLDSNSVEYAFVPYMLQKTLSKSGSVSRGICEVDNGYLRSITEHTRIFYEKVGRVKKIMSEDDDGTKVELTGKELVSMNFFGFTPRVFETLEEQFKEFIYKYVDSEKKECLLPECLGNAIRTGKCRVKYYTTTESWFGITYPKDKALVQEELKKKIKSGYYPEFLWR